MKTILFPYVVLVHSLAMLLGMAAMLFLVITGKMSTPLAYVLPTLTVSLAATSCKLAMLLAKTTEQNALGFSPARFLIRQHFIDAFA